MMDPVWTTRGIMGRVTSHIVWLCLGFMTTLVQSQTFTPVSFTLPSPPALLGTLSPNYALYNAEKVHTGKTIGPTSFTFHNGNVYMVTADRLVVNAASCPPQVIANMAPTGCSTIQQCGQLTSIRVDQGGQLLVLDAYRGLFSINPLNGVVTQMYSSAMPVGGRRPMYLNDMVVANDGTILISDSSDKFDAANDIYIIMEGRTSGRILAFTPATKSMAVLIENVMAFPNGLELTADGSQLLVAESGRARILSVGLTASNWKQVGVFAGNLPGMPGNIRRSPRNTYWVGLSNVRQAGHFSSMDAYSARPMDRLKTVQSVPKETIRGYYSKYGLLLELDAQGRVLGSLHDPTGMVMSSISEAQEYAGLLYVGSSGSQFTGRIVLPQGGGREVTLDGVLQVLRSRCQVAEKDLPRARQVLLEYIARQTAQNPITPTQTQVDQLLPQTMGTESTPVSGVSVDVSGGSLSGILAQNP